MAVATTNREGFVVASKAFAGNPYDGHTLAATNQQVVRITGVEPTRYYADRGYRGHDYDKPERIFISGRRRGLILANGHRVAKLALIRRLLDQPTPPKARANADYRQRLRDLIGIDLDCCPRCGGIMRVIDILPRPRSPPSCLFSRDRHEHQTPTNTRSHGRRGDNVAGRQMPWLCTVDRRAHHLRHGRDQPCPTPSHRRLAIGPELTEPSPPRRRTAAPAHRAGSAPRHNPHSPNPPPWVRSIRLQ